MHIEAHEGFGWILKQSGIDPEHKWHILDLGGQHINGSVHDYFPNSKITTLDIENADIIADATTWEPNQLFDLVITTETFEHVRDWPRIIATARKALDPDGPGLFFVTCASTNRPRHGATGAPDPVRGEWYKNVEPNVLQQWLGQFFNHVAVEYRYPPGDAYAWASR